ncbi:MAG: class II aldolase/adducin family protein [Anaerolineales bacterium]
MNLLAFSSQASLAELRQAILECGRLCYERRLMTANDGNISVRVDAERVLITPSGLSKGRMEAEDLILLDLDGHVLQAAAGRKPSSETPMHLEAYRQRPDIRAVIHAHPVFATTLTVAGLDLPLDVLPEVLLTLGEIPTTAYATPASHEDAEVIRDLIRNHNALLLRQHGSLTVGAHLEEALIHLERLEHVAQVYYQALLLGRVERIPPQAMQRLYEIRQTFSVK